MVFYMPESNRPGGADYYPVATSELIENITNLQPLVMSPFPLMPSLDPKVLDEMSDGEYFADDVSSSTHPNSS